MSRRKSAAWMVAAMLMLAAVWVQASSRVRIVRLSYVDGSVQMDRANGGSLERAVLNSPVVEGSRIVTGNNGLAEVEFENSSVVRLGEDTEVRFTQLLLNDAGDKVNEVQLVHGTVYFDTRHAKGDIDRVIAVGRTFVVRHDSQVRFILSGDQVQAAVFNGEAHFDNNSALVAVKKNETLTVDANNPSGALLAKGVDSLPLDRWSNERAAYQTAYSYNNSGYGSRGMNGFGYSDLAYYGDWFSAPGYGMVWQPYGAFGFAGWNPYVTGAWAFTPGFGYVWASAYPWGWLPYHYGAWSYAPNYGWFWYPGNSFSGGGATNWQPTTTVTNAPVGYKPPVAPVAPSFGSKPLVAVGNGGGASPAYLPDGPVPPNFRSVITDHSGMVGTANPASVSATSGGGSSGATANSRSAASARSVSGQNSHVFVPPTHSQMPSLMHGGYTPSASEGGMRGNMGSTHAATTGTSHASHGSSASPK